VTATSDGTAQGMSGIVANPAGGSPLPPPMTVVALT
jgi:hypothetical protein